MNVSRSSRVLSRVTTVLASATTVGALVLCTDNAAAAQRKHCTGPVTCLQAKGAQLKVNRVQLWAPTGAAPNGDALIAVWVGIYDTSGPSNYQTTDPLYKHRGILDPNPDADAYNGSYYVIDSTGATDAEYSNGCEYQPSDPSNPFLEFNFGPPRNTLLYPHQADRNVALCFAVANPTHRLKLVWYPNHDHTSHPVQATLPGARTYSGTPVPKLPGA
jgi:hypothetical protein